MYELKASLRATALRARRDLDVADRQAASEAIAARLRRLPALRQARTVLLYAATADEVDLGELIEPLHQRGVRTLFPRVRGEQLDLVAATDLLALRLGYRGIREPSGPPIDPEVVDVALVPGVAFDFHGGRLGQGGGHYDRLLAQLDPAALRVGVCFSCQVVPRVPMGEHDALIDVVVTEGTVHATGARPEVDPDQQA